MEYIPIYVRLAKSTGTGVQLRHREGRGFAMTLYTFLYSVLWVQPCTRWTVVGTRNKICQA